MSVAMLYDWLCRILGIGFMLFIVYVLISGLRQPLPDAAPGAIETVARPKRSASTPPPQPRWERRADGVVVLLSGEQRGET